MQTRLTQNGGLLSYCLDAVGTLELPLHFILTHARLSLAVQVRFASQVHRSIKQQSHRRLAGYNERD